MGTWEQGKNRREQGPPWETLSIKRPPIKLPPSINLQPALQSTAWFLKGKSTTSQLLEVSNDFGGMLDNQVQVDTIYLDFAKAFDRVDHIIYS